MLTVPALRFPLLGDVPHAISTRHGGVSTGPYRSLNLGYSTADTAENVLTNRTLFAGLLGFPREQVVSGWITHGKEVSVFRADQPESWPDQHLPVRSDSAHRERVFRSDAVISDATGLTFMLTFADCVPLLFADRRLGVIGAAHAGWRGTAQGIALAVVEAMRSEFGTQSRDILAAIGPSIGPCCYTVGPDVRESFQANGQTAVTIERDDNTYLDLWSTNERQLHSAGVPTAAIDNPRICTACHTDRFYSHRAEFRKTGRFAAGITCP